MSPARPAPVVCARRPPRPVNQPHSTGHFRRASAGRMVRPVARTRSRSVRGVRRTVARIFGVTCRRQPLSCVRSSAPNSNHAEATVPAPDNPDSRPSMLWLPPTMDAPGRAIGGNRPSDTNALATTPWACKPAPITSFCSNRSLRPGRHMRDSLWWYLYSQSLSPGWGNGMAGPPDG